MERIIDIAIIGGGPAGLAAGLYGARGDRSTTLFEELFPGGQITSTANVENYPGFDEGIDGFELASRIEKQAKRFGMELINGRVTRLDLTEPLKRITCDDGTFLAKSVIISTGAKPRKLGLDREDALIGAGISYCATCDGAFFRGKAVAVVGGGDTGLTDALYLSQFSKKVYLVHRRADFRATKALQDRVFANPNIELCLSVTPTAILGNSNVEGLAVQNIETGEGHTLPVSGIFIAVGTTPSTALVKDQVRLDAGGYIVTDARMATSRPGVFAAGDVRVTPLRQVVTAVADGAVAATAAIEYLSMI